MSKKIKSMQKIIDVAFELFHAQGVHATGIDAILKKSGAGKSQFYHYFKNKDDLIHEVMQHTLTMLKSGTLSNRYQIKTWKDLEEWFRFIVESQKSAKCERSCPIATIGCELRNDQELLRKDACEIFDFIQNSLADFFRAAKKKGELSTKCNPESLADFCVAMTQGGLLVAKIRRNIKPLENAVTQTINYINSLKQA